MTLVLASLAFASLLISPAQTAGGAARVAGQVIDAESRAPISGARVMLMPAGVNPVAMAPLQAVTNASGEFVFERLAAGRFRIEVEKVGFAPLANPGDMPRTVDIAAGQVLTGLELALTRAGAIAGRIIDAGGEPLSSITVMALRFAAGGPGPFTAKMAQPNDGGEFRLAGLAEGEYVVIAAPPPRPPFAPPSASAGGRMLAPTYYPGTTEREAAQHITVAAGQTVGGLQLSMIAAAAYQVTGVVVDEAGAPVSGAMVMLLADSRNGGTGTPVMGRSEANGVFQIDGVVSGEYRLMATNPTASIGRNGAPSVGPTGGVFVGGALVSGGGPGVNPPGPGAGPATNVTVNGADVTGLRIVVVAQKERR